jgi:hypothetical protein
LIKNIPWQEDPVPHSFNLHLSVNFDEMFKASQAQILDKQVQKQLTQNLTDKPAT